MPTVASISAGDLALHIGDGEPAQRPVVRAEQLRIASAHDQPGAAGHDVPEFFAIHVEEFRVHHAVDRADPAGHSQVGTGRVDSNGSGQFQP
jgi:hypothetical protein